MKKVIKDRINLDELNGEVITTWISKLLDLQKQYGVCATISAEGDDGGYGGCNIGFYFNRLETDEEYEYRLEREAYLERIEKSKHDALRQVEIRKQYAEKKAELEALELELKRGY